MRKTGPFLTLFLPAMLLLASEGQDFRKFDWKTQKAEVLKRETLPLVVERPDMLGYSSQFLSRTVLVMYGFERGRLVRGGYRFLSDYADKNMYISEYRRLVAYLKKAWGDPFREVSSWKNPLFRKNPAEWGLAVSVGHLAFQTVWENGRSVMAAELKGQDHDVTFVLEYYDLERAAQLFHRL